MTTPASANKTVMRIKEETSLGVLPASPIFETIRMTGESISHDPSTSISQELDADPTVKDILRESVQAAGATNHEVSYGAQDKLIWAGMFADSTPGGLVVDQSASDVSFIDADNSVNTAAGDFVAAGFLVNRWIVMKNTTTGAAPQFAKVVSVATGKMVLSHFDAEDVTAGDTWRIVMPDRATNGTTLKSYGVEFEMDAAAAADAFKYIKGGVPGAGLEFSFDTEGRLLLTVNWLGQVEQNPGATASTGGTPTAAPTNKVLSVVDNLKAVHLDGLTHRVSGISFAIAPNLQPIRDAGYLETSDFVQGTYEVTGAVNFYYRDSVEYQKFLDHTDSAASYVFMDDSEQGYIIDIPAAVYSSGGRNSEGQNQPVESSLGFAAKKHTAQGIALAIYPFAL